MRGPWHNVIPAGFKTHVPSDLSKGSPTSAAAPAQCPPCPAATPEPTARAGSGGTPPTLQSLPLGSGNPLQLPALADKAISFHLLLPLTPPFHYFFIIFWLHPKARAALGALRHTDVREAARATIVGLLS